MSDSDHHSQAHVLGEEGEIVIPCMDLAANMAFFTDHFGFRLAEIFPADEPRSALIFGQGLRLRLIRSAEETGLPRLRLRGKAGSKETVRAPNGLVVEFVASDDGIMESPSTRHDWVLTQGGDDWGVGRAGMLYRDLLPGRLGGAFIASHIRIPEGGPVPDIVHFHKVRFQVIYCLKGWVRLVYEDQGEPFILAAGDCVLQPPQIRHRVLEASAGLEVIELGAPAEHMTLIDHDMTLPTATLRPERSFNGQLFCWHRADQTDWQEGPGVGVVSRDSGLTAATGGVASLRTLRFDDRPNEAVFDLRHQSDIAFYYLVTGQAALQIGDNLPVMIASDSAFVVPPNQDGCLESVSEDLEILQVILPAA